VGLDLDEIDSARQFHSRDEREAALLRYLQTMLENSGVVPVHLHEEAREHGWTDEQILEALAHVALADFSSLVTLAGEIPLEGTSREVKPLKKVA
jgi:alkylhydroperoxidase family enzyme